MVPDAIQELLERTYRDQTVGELTYADQADADELLRLLRIHANRRNLKLHAETATSENGPLLRFKMRDKRVYTKRAACWNQQAGG